MMAKTLEIRVPISPVPHYFRRVHFMAASLQRLSKSLGDYELVVCVGADEEPRNLYELLPWSNEYPLLWRWVDRARFQQDNYWETGHERFRQHGRSRFVMCADADVIFVRDFSDLLTDLDRSPAIAGVIAHITPFKDTTPSVMWQQLFEAYGIVAGFPTYEHTGWGFMSTDLEARFAPPYFNFGMVLAPFNLMDQISAEIVAADQFVKKNLSTIYRFQIALTLAILKLQLPTRALPLRYNFPNDPRFDQKYPDDLDDVRILHYLRVQGVDRKKDFASLANVAALIKRRDLSGSNEVCRRCLEEIYPVVAEQEARVS